MTEGLENMCPYHVSICYFTQEIVGLGCVKCTCRNVESGWRYLQIIGISFVVKYK